MKTKLLILAAVAAFTLVGCGPKVADKTVVSGIFEAEAPSEVEIAIADLGFKKSFPVVDGSFRAEVPTFKVGHARFLAGKVIGNFIPDGTPLTIIVKGDKSVEVASKYPKISVHAKYRAFQKGMSDLQETYQPQIEATRDDEAKEQLYEAYQTDVKSLCLDAVAKNKDNFIAVQAIENLKYLLDNNEMDSVLATVDETVANVESVQKIASVVSARKATSEGMKFTDFTVDGQKLSDFVGKGKYVLVDFWASWCGPCKAEVPNLKEIYAKYAGADFDMLGVAVWDKPDKSTEEIDAFGLEWNQIINAQSIPTNLYGIQGIPYFILFGPDGTILKRDDLRGEEIEAEVTKYVKPVK